MPKNSLSAIWSLSWTPVDLLRSVYASWHVATATLALESKINSDTTLLVAYKQGAH